MRFFLSLDDELLMRFAGDGLRTAMTALGLGADDEVSHPLVVKAIRNARKKIVRFGPLLEPTTDLAADLVVLDDFFAGSVGRRGYERSFRDNRSIVQ